MATVNYNTLIPNNVNLSTDRRLQRALEQWHPKFLNWWLHQGPRDFQSNEVYLRTAVGVDRSNWAKFGFVRMLCIGVPGPIRPRRLSQGSST